MTAMKIDTGSVFDAGDTGTLALVAEDAGYDGLWVAETGHDPFIPLALAAARTERIELGTGIAVAFARNPMSMAMLANDLQACSKGRFLLGLGSQIKPHIEKRFSMPWSHPAPRMREYILAMRAIWECWQTGARLAFRGDFYTHTLMSPFFDPGPNPYGAPKVFLAAVGPRMCEVAGEVADGLIVHGFTTERYLRDVTLPALARGLARGGKGREDVQISLPGFVVAGSTADEVRAAGTFVKRQIAFYGSTPAYRPVLDHHGWGELQVELNRLSKRGAWEEMGNLIDDEVLETFAVVCEPGEVPARVLGRFGGLVDRFSAYAPPAGGPEEARGIVRGFRAASASPSSRDRS